MPTSKKGTTKSDPAVKPAIIAAVASIVTVLITALIAPAVLRLLEATPTATPIPTNSVNTPTAVSSPTFVSAQFTLDKAKFYSIESADNGTVLDVKGGSTADTTPIIRYGWEGGTNQEWRFEPLSDSDVDYYLIRSVKSDKCMDVQGSTQDDGGVVMQYHCAKTDNQKWEILPVNSTTVILRVKHSGKALTGVGSDVIQSSYEGDKNQQWILTIVGP